MPIGVPRPEHLIAMTVQAMKDAPDRTLQDLADISYLLRLPGVDRLKVQGYFSRAGMLQNCHASSTGIGPRAMRALSPSPSTSSITKARAPPDS